MKIGDTICKNIYAQTQIDATSEIFSYPAVMVLKGKMPIDIINKANEYIEHTNNNLAAPALAATISGDQSVLDNEEPLMQELYEELLKGCFSYQNFAGKSGIKSSNNSHRTVILDICWCVKMNPTDYSPAHTHNSNARSGLTTVCYVKVPEHISKHATNEEEINNVNGRKDGFLHFTWDGQNTSMEDDYCPGTAKLVVPVVGDYYIFPKWLTHTIYPFQGDGQRWSINANFSVYTDNELKLISSPDDNITNINESTP